MPNYKRGVGNYKNQGTGGQTFARVVKKVDETIQSDTTLHDDDELVVALTANKSYHFFLVFLYNSGATPDMKVGFTVPSGATMVWTVPATNGLNAFDETDSDVFTGSSSDRGIFYFGSCIMSSTAGNLQVQWAQNTSDATDSTILQGSILAVWEET